VTDAFLDHSALLLVLIAAALYLVDLAKLLYINELVFARGSGGGWSVHLPSTQIEIGRRFVVIARPLDPAVSVFRMAWPTLSLGKDRPAAEAIPNELAGLLRELRLPRLGCTLLLPQIFLGVPVLHVLGGTDLSLLILLIVYLQVAVLIGWLFVRRGHLRLPWSTCLLIAFESLVCVPYAINLHRKLSERLLPAVVPGDVVEAAALLLDGNAFEDFRRRMCQRARQSLVYGRDRAGSEQELLDFLSRLDPRR
jgi:hypothetical protein